MKIVRTVEYRLALALRNLLAGSGQRPTGDRVRRCRPRLEGLESRDVPAVYTVTNPNDVFDGTFNIFGTYTEGPDGKMSLAEAIANANVSGASGPFHPGPNTINFNLPGPVPAQGFWDLTVRFSGNVEPLDITNRTTIDGYSQPGATANTLAQGSDAKLLIKLDNRLNITTTYKQAPSEQQEVRGLSVAGIDIRPTDDGFGVFGAVGNNTVAGNWIGIDPAGNAMPGTGIGVTIGTVDHPADNNLIGGVLPKDRNVIALNAGLGLLVDNGTGNAIRGNEFFGNGGGGIRISPGANLNRPAPVLVSGSATTIGGTLSAAPAGSKYTIELFTNAGLDPFGEYEGQRFLKSTLITAKADGTFAIPLSGLPAGPTTITATVTDDQGNSSRFSNGINVVGGPSAGVEITSVKSKLATVSAPGQKDTVKVTLKNGTVNKLTAPIGTTLLKLSAVNDANDEYLLGQSAPLTKAVVLGAGKSLTLTLSFTFPNYGIASTLPADQYKYKADIDPTLTSPPSGGPNVRGKLISGTGATEFNHVYKFGTVDGVSGVPIIVDEPDGSKTTYVVAGDGMGTLSGIPGALDLDLSATSAHTAIASKNNGTGTVLLRNIHATTPVGGIYLLSHRPAGTVAFDKGLREIELFALGALPTSALVIGKAPGKPVPTKMTFDRVIDADITAADGIKSLITSKWLDTDGSPDVITAPFLDQLTVQAATPTVFDASLDLAGNPNDEKYALGRAQIKGDVRGNWKVGTGGIGSDTALGALDVSVSSASSWALDVAGRLKKLKVVGDFNSASVSGPTIKAKTIDSLFVGGTLEATSIDVNGADAQGQAIGNFGVGLVAQLGQINTPLGGIQRLFFTDWQALTDITTSWIQTLTGTLTSNLNLDLTGERPTTGVSLKTAKVGGTLTGRWSAAGDIGSVAVGGDLSWQLVVDPLAVLGKVRVQGSVGGLTNITAGAIGNFEVEGTLRGAITANGVLAPISIGRLEARNVNDATVTATNGIGKVGSSGDWLNSRLTADHVDAFLAGSVTAGSKLTLPGGAETIIVAALLDSTIDATGGTIGWFKILEMTFVNPPRFSNSNVTADTIKKVVIADVNSAGAADYGITAHHVLLYSRRVNGEFVTLTENGKPTTTLHDPAIGTPDIDGRFRLTIN